MRVLKFKESKSLVAMLKMASNENCSTQCHGHCFQIHTSKIHLNSFPDITEFCPEDWHTPEIKLEIKKI